MKKIVFSLLALTALLTFWGCTKECDECEKCENKTDTVIKKDTIYVPPPPDTSCKTDLTKGLIAYFPFNGNFNDESGNGNNATAKNGALISTDFLGRPNKAASFDGYDDYLIVPGSSKLNSDTITVSFQIMSTNVNRNFAAISRINFANAQSCVWNVHMSKSVDTFWTFSVPPGTDDCSKMYTSPDPSLYAYSKGPIKANRWYNVIVTFAGGVQNIYVDGVLEASKTRTFTKLKKCDNADLVIGGWWASDIMSLGGKMDEVRVYNRALSSCEIAKLAFSWN